MSAAKDILSSATRLSLQEVAWCHSEKHADFIAEVLRIAVADEDGALPAVGNRAAISMYMGMLIAGWASRRDGMKGGPWIITEEGRAIHSALAKSAGEP